MRDEVNQSATESVRASDGDDARKPNRKKGFWTAVLVVALLVFVGSLIALGVIAFSYFQGQQKYGDLAQNVEESVGDAEASDEAVVTVDWDALRAINPDVVAWVLIPNTGVNYPVAQASDNEYYLTHDFYGEEGWLAQYGSIFLDYRNTPTLTDDANFIYGHHMNDGSMFAAIADLADQQRFDDCRTVYVVTPETTYRLRTFSLIHCAADDQLVVTKFATPEEMRAYVQDKVDRSVVSVDDSAAALESKTIFAFATCDNVSGGRYVLYARPE